MRHGKSTVKSDVAIEKACGKFLDKYFYSKLTDGIRFTRIEDKKLQLLGVDIVVNGICIDEKAKVYGNLNKILQYPSVELLLVNSKGNLELGWFLKKNMRTDYYAFIAVFTSALEPGNIRFSNIEKLNVLFVSKNEIEKYVNQTGIDLKSEALSLFDDIEDNKRTFEHGLFHLTHSRQLVEKPVNLVLKRAELEKLPHSKEIEVTRGNWIQKNHCIETENML